MLFLYWYRQLSLENTPFLQEGASLIGGGSGVFGREDQEEIIMEVEENIENMHRQREKNEDVHAD